MKTSEYVALADLLPGDAAALATDVLADRVPGVIGRTSGSTGGARELVLPSAAIRHAAQASNAVIGTGQWLAALPPVTIGGFMVWVRALAAGLPPLHGLDAPLTSASLTGHMSHARGMLTVSLVPTQLQRLVADLDDTERLDGLTVLLGGAASPPALVEAARARGILVIRSYGMTETCGGCILDGRPIDGVRVRTDESGRLLIAGPVLTAGYVEQTGVEQEPLFLSDDEGATWLRTNDIATVVDGVVSVIGRADDMIISGGLNIAPAVVEAALGGLPSVAECCVVGVPDAEWGQAVTAMLVLRPGADAPSLDEVRDVVTAATRDRRMAPRSVVVVDDLPRIGPGKVDRREVIARLTRDGRAQT